MELQEFVRLAVDARRTARRAIDLDRVTVVDDAQRHLLERRREAAQLGRDPHAQVHRRLRHAEFADLEVGLQPAPVRRAAGALVAPMRMLRPSRRTRRRIRSQRFDRLNADRAGRDPRREKAKRRAPIHLVFHVSISNLGHRGRIPANRVPTRGRVGRNLVNRDVAAMPRLCRFISRPNESWFREQGPRRTMEVSDNNSFTIPAYTEACWYSTLRGRVTRYETNSCRR